MKNFPIIIFLLILCAACNNNKTKPIISQNNSTPQITNGDTVSNFFPVTTYLKGEIFGIKKAGITPLRKIIIGNKTDSSWVKMEDIDKVLATFLSPIIDTANLKETFDEKKFKDETLNAFTFTYDPKNLQTNSFAFIHWDVYVDPETNKVKRVYLIKKVSESEVLQLTWQSGKSCKIITLKDTGNNNLVKEKEELISWKFE